MAWAPGLFIAGLFLILGLAGCSSHDSCLDQVANRPGMTCLDVGLGWYHIQFASQPPQNHGIDPAQASGARQLGDIPAAVDSGSE